MKNKLQLLICIVLLKVSFSNSIDVFVEPIIYQFTTDYKMTIYRSGLLKTPIIDKWWQTNMPTTFPTVLTDIENPITSFQKWQNGYDNEYNIIWNKPDTVFVNYLTVNINNKNILRNKYTFDSLFKEVRFDYYFDYNSYRDNFMLNKYPKISAKDLVQKARIKARDYLSCFKGLIEDDGANILTLNNSVFGVEVTYRRIFRHGLLPSTISKILVSMDVNCNIQKLLIKWPTFENASTVSETAIDFNEGISIASKVFSSITNLDHDGDTIPCQKADLIGMACAWKYIKNGREIITPCYNFEAKMTLTNDSTIVQKINVPRLKKYIKL